MSKTTTDHIALCETHVSRGIARLARWMNAPREISAAGSQIITETGESFLNCGGYSVLFAGHNHPQIVAAVSRQLETLPISSRLLVNGVMIEAAHALAGFSPPGLSKVFFANSGAEAVEVSLKLAHANGRRRLIAMEGGYHGKTLGALSVTSNPAYRSPFLTWLPPVEFIPFGDLDALDLALAASSGDACVIVEPVQAEAGVRIPPPGYLTGVGAACRQHGALFIADEIQTGLGRLGWRWGVDRDGVVPDILLSGKALGGGVMPVSAVVATPEVFAPLDRDPFLHSSTFAGNPLAMSAVLASLEVIQSEKLVARARALGDILLSGLRELLNGAPRIREVRGLGLLIAIEFEDPPSAGEFAMNLLKERVIVCHSLNATRTVRLTPPAILSEADVAFLFAAVRHVIRR